MVVAASSCGGDYFGDHGWWSRVPNLASREVLLLEVRVWNKGPDITSMVSGTPAMRSVFRALSLMTSVM